MYNEVFGLNNFNVFEDENNYYFFRALEEVDLESIENKTIVDENGKITRLITDREFYGALSGYTEESNISLEEVLSHIKMHYDRHTNCISFSSNANVALMYGREIYNDNYVMIRVPKSQMGQSVYNAGLYLLQEINNRINNIVQNHELEDYDFQKFFLDAIDRAETEEDLHKIRLMLSKEYVSQEPLNSDNFFEGKPEFRPILSKNFLSLNQRQNLEKNKIVLKLDVLNKQLLPKMSNRFLVQTLGLAFSSLEIIHYKDVDGNKLMRVPKEMVDVFSILQQMPSNLEYIDEIKSIVLRKYLELNPHIEFLYPDCHIANLTLDNLYEITQGKVDYKTAITLYKKAFYLAKSKLRARCSVIVLSKLLDNNTKYGKTLRYIYGNMDMELNLK